MTTTTIDLTGQRFTRLLVVSQAPSQNGAMWNCRCDCGGTTVVSGGNLRKGQIKSCGCLHRESPRLNPRPSRAIDLTGQQFGRLSVISRATKDGRGEWSWHCRCDCGQEKTVLGYSLRSGLTKSCGCYMVDNAKSLFTTHASTGTPEYKCWQSMLKRCRDGEDKRYGGRGIRVCRRWKKFANFLADMGTRPSQRHTIERVDNDGPYAPENCVWATRAVQARNKSANRIVTYRGQSLPLVDALQASGNIVKRTTARNRLDCGWSVELALETPARPLRRPHRHSPCGGAPKRNW